MEELKATRRCARTKPDASMKGLRSGKGIATTSYSSSLYRSQRRRISISWWCSLFLPAGVFLGYPFHSSCAVQLGRVDERCDITAINYRHCFCRRRRDSSCDLYSWSWLTPCWCRSYKHGEKGKIGGGGKRDYYITRNFFPDASILSLLTRVNKVLRYFIILRRVSGHR